MPLRQLALTALATAVLATAAPAARDNGPAPNTLTDAEKKAGWILLFDGHSLDGWRAYKKPDAAGLRWKIDDNSLSLPAQTEPGTRAGDILSKDTFEQFELSVDWKVAPGSNSGIKYFVLEDRDSAIGHEYQVIDDERHPDAKVGPHRQTRGVLRRVASVRSAAETGRRMEQHANRRARTNRRALVERQEGAAVRVEQPGPECGD